MIDVLIVLCGMVVTFLPLRVLVSIDARRTSRDAMRWGFVREAERAMAQLNDEPEALRVARLEHEALAPEFLETQSILFDSLGHPKTCEVCYPPKITGLKIRDSAGQIRTPRLRPTYCDHVYRLDSTACVLCGKERDAWDVWEALDEDDEREDDDTDLR